MILFVDGCDSIGKSFYIGLYKEPFPANNIISYKATEFNYQGSWTEKWIKIKKFLDEVEEKTGKAIMVDRSPLSEIVYNDNLSKIDRHILLKLIKKKDRVFILKRSYEDYLLCSSLKSKRDEFDILSEKQFYAIQRKFLTFAVPGSNVHWC